QETNWEIAMILSAIFAASFAGSVLISLSSESPRPPLFKKIGSIVIGVLISGTIITISIILSSALLKDIKYLDPKIIGLALGMGLAIGLVTRSWLRGIAVGLIFGGIMSFLGALSPEPNSLGSAMIGSISNGLLFSLLFALPYLWARTIADTWAGVIAGLLGSGGVYIVFLIPQDSMILLYSILAVSLGLTQLWWRPLLFYPFEAALSVLLSHAEMPDSIHWHAAFWDEHQRLPLYGLEKHLIKIAQQNPAAMTYLRQTPQAWAVQAAQIELYFRHLQRCTTIHTAYQALPTGKFDDKLSNYLSELGQISRNVKLALEIENDYEQRQRLEQVTEALGELLRNLALSTDSQILRLWTIAENWRQSIAESIRKLTELIESKREIDNPYITGRPLMIQSKALFVGRREISTRIDLLLRNQYSSPILIYGQRRVGKTSLLNFFSELLSDHYVPLFVDLQGPVSGAANHSDFFYTISRAMIKSARETRQLDLPPLSRETLQDDPFGQFDEWLDNVEDCGRTVLLTFDEFEALDQAFQKKRLDKDLILGMFRHIIQHRPRFKIVIAGAYRLEAYPDWANYLNNIETLKLSYLQENEAIQLIEKTKKSLRYTPSATQRILELTGCHPALVQWLCKEIIILKNQQDTKERDSVQREDVMAVVPKVSENAKAQFTPIFLRPAAENEILRLLAAQGEGAVVSQETLRYDGQEKIEEILSNLVQNELIESTAGGYRFQVELFRRWLTTG
ncbi:MAG: ATP-binding protein, partial [Pseudomonadota bacterium]